MPVILPPTNSSTVLGRRIDPRGPVLLMKKAVAAPEAFPLFFPASATWTISRRKYAKRLTACAPCFSTPCGT